MKPIQHEILVGKEDRPLSGGRVLILVEHSAETLAPMHRTRQFGGRGGS
jgi:hypothetical protein